MTTIAIIPARGGSKRIPRKNIRLFAGQPMIAHPIKLLKSSGLFDHIVVSTDDDEIADIARDAGAEVPFMRPESLSDDHAGTAMVVRHAIEWFDARDTRPDYVCCVYATTPLLQLRYLHAGWEEVSSGRKPLALSVARYAHPVQRALQMTENGGVAPLYPDLMSSRSQDLLPTYHDAGQFYWGTRDAFMQGLSVFSDSAAPIVLPRHLMVDIDEEEDWIQAESLFRAMQMEGQ